MTRRTLFSLVHLSDSRHSSQGRGASFALFICASFWIVHDNPSPPQMTWRENSAQTLPPRTRCSIACRFVGFTRKRHETSSVSFIFLFVNLTTVAQTCFSVSFFLFFNYGLISALPEIPRPISFILCCAIGDPTELQIKGTSPTFVILAPGTKTCARCNLGVTNQLSLISDERSLSFAALVNLTPII